MADVVTPTLVALIVAAGAILLPSIDAPGGLRDMLRWWWK